MHSAVISHIYENFKVIRRGAALNSLDISDHCLIYVSQKKHKIVETPERVKCRNYNKLDDSKFQISISKLNWTPVLDESNVDTIAELLNNILLPVCDQHAPMRTINVKANAPT